MRAIRGWFPTPFPRVVSGCAIYNEAFRNAIDMTDDCRLRLVMRDPALALANKFKVFPRNSLKNRSREFR